MRLPIIGITLLILVLLASIAFGQTPPTLTWGVALDGYVIERSYDGGITFKKLVELPETATSYTDLTAYTDAPGPATQICYRISPKLSQGVSFYGNATCLNDPVPQVVVTIDNGQAGTTPTGTWTTTTAAGFFGTNSLVSGNSNARYKWTPNLTGDFEVFAWWVANATHSTAAVYRIRLANGNTVLINKSHRTNGARFNSLGVYTLGPGSYVELSAQNGTVSADAVRFTEQ